MKTYSRVYTTKGDNYSTIGRKNRSIQEKSTISEFKCSKSEIAKEALNNLFSKN